MTLSKYPDRSAFCLLLTVGVTGMVSGWKLSHPRTAAATPPPSRRAGRTSKSR